MSRSALVLAAFAVGFTLGRWDGASPFLGVCAAAAAGALIGAFVVATFVTVQLARGGDKSAGHVSKFHPSRTPYWSEPPERERERK